MKPPFEFVFVHADGTVRELSILEKLELRTRYGFGDGGRPYIKHTYEEKNGWGNLRGYCRRDRIPSSVDIEDQAFNITQREIMQRISRIRKMGYRIDIEGLEEECGIPKE